MKKYKLNKRYKRMFRAITMPDGVTLIAKQGIGGYAVIMPNSKAYRFNRGRKGKGEFPSRWYASPIPFFDREFDYPGFKTLYHSVHMIYREITRQRII